MADRLSGSSAAAESSGGASIRAGRPTPEDLAYTNLTRPQIRAAKQRARRAVWLAIQSGLLKREPCFRCGTTEKVQAHHTDYNEPLLVVWACQDHHSQIHREERPPAEPRPLATIVKWCRCGQPLPAVGENTRGRRPRFCSRCREERKALRFVRAAGRILENLRDPEWEAS